LPIRAHVERTPEVMQLLRFETVSDINVSDELTNAPLKSSVTTPLPLTLAHLWSRPSLV